MCFLVTVLSSNGGPKNSAPSGFATQSHFLLQSKPGGGGGTGRGKGCPLS